MSVAREALPFALVTGIVTAAAAWWHPLAAVIPALAFLFVIWFFRDPERTPPDEPDVLVSPADGKIIRASGDRISIFMNVFNVHVCRTPFAGTVREVEHSPGRFLAAFKDEAPLQNERTRISVSTGGFDLEFTLIAGLVARRIVCKVKPGQTLQRGERVGLIRFGSRVDVVLPPGGRAEVRVGDTVQAGQTVLARVPGRGTPGG